MSARRRGRLLAHVSGAPDFGTYLALDSAPGLRRTHLSRWPATAEVALDPALSGRAAVAILRLLARYEPREVTQPGAVEDARWPIRR